MYVILSFISVLSACDETLPVRVMNKISAESFVHNEGVEDGNRS